MCVLKQHFGKDMSWILGISCGIVSWLIILFCGYNKESELDSLIDYIFKFDYKRVLLFALCLIIDIGFVCLFVLYGYGPLKIIRYLLLLPFLVLISIRDAKEHIIPNRILIILLIIRVVLFAIDCFVFPEIILENIKFTLLGMFTSGAIFLIAYIISKHAIGMGDVKLIAVIGSYLGSGATYFAIIASLVFCAVYSLIQVARKKKTMKDGTAFGPFIAIGTVVVMLIGA